MAKKAYVGVNGISKNVKNIYVGVNGVPKKVVKGYVGVNGVPKVFWDGGTPPTPVISSSWDYWTSVSGQFLTIKDLSDPTVGWVCSKANNKIAYFAVFEWMFDMNTQYAVLLISPDPDAVTMDIYYEKEAVTRRIYKAYTTVTDANGITWYYAAMNITRVNETDISFTPYCILNRTAYRYATDAINVLISKIYAVPFHEDYQIGTRYKLGITDVRKTIRKVISTALYSGVLTKASDPAYIAFSDNADAIISNLMSVATSHIMELQVQAYSNIVYIYLFSTSMLETPYVQIDTDRGGGIFTQNGYTYMYLIDAWQASGLYPDFQYVVEVDENGNITYSYEEPFKDVDYQVGMYLDKSNNLIDTQMTNLGIDL